MKRERRIEERMMAPKNRRKIQEGIRQSEIPKKKKEERCRMRHKKMEEDSEVKILGRAGKSMSKILKNYYNIQT